MTRCEKAQLHNEKDFTKYHWILCYAWNKYLPINPRNANQHEQIKKKSANYHWIHIVHRIRNFPITRARVVNGVSSAGLTTQVQPAARAAATCFCIFKSLAQNKVANTKRKVSFESNLPCRHSNREVPRAHLMVVCICYLNNSKICLNLQNLQNS